MADENITEIHSYDNNGSMQRPSMNAKTIR